MMGLMPAAERGLVKPRRAVDAVAIEERQRGIAELRRAIDERFRKRGALKKAEGGGGVELDVIRTSSVSPLWLINDRIDEPPVGVPIAKDPVDRAVAERDVPLVAVPEASRHFLLSRGAHPLPHALASLGLAALEPLQRLKAAAPGPESRSSFSLGGARAVAAGIGASWYPTILPTCATGRQTVPFPANPRRSVVTRTGRSSSTATRAGTGWR